MGTHITVNLASDEFFIAVAKNNNNLHSFVVAGVVQNNIPILLAVAGKHKHGNGYIFTTESISSVYDDSINYTAYSINFDQYKQFIDLLSNSATQQVSRKARCYIPFPNKKTLPLMTLTFSELQYATAPTPSQQRLLKRATHLTPTNTCRHTAIDTIEYIQETNEATQHVSRFFFMDLLLKYDLPKQNDKKPATPIHPFYILPAPPHAHNVGIETSAVLIKLYHRMHHLLKKDPYSQCTQNKFKALKTLYQTLSGQPHDDLNVLLTSIQQWKNEYHASISPLRQQGLFGQLLNQLSISYKSSTQTLVDEIEKEISVRASQ